MSLKFNGMQTVLDKLVELDSTIRDCEHGLLVAKRLKAKGRPPSETLVEEVRLKLDQARKERDSIDAMLKKKLEKAQRRICKRLSKPA